jgi:branched-chain amino acid aminotransferase
MARLRHSADMLTLPVPIADEAMLSRCAKTMQAMGLGSPGQHEAYIRILVTRGVGELSYDPASCPDPTIVIITKPHVDPPAHVYERGVKAALVSTVRNHPGTVNPLIKSNNLLNNALAMQEAFRLGAFEGIMRNYRGELAECTQSNLFIVVGGEVLTPPLDAGLLPGITREFLFEIGVEIGIRIREAVLKDEDLFAADEAFLTSTTREVVPIVEVDVRKVGSGVPGPVTHALLASFRDRARRLSASIDGSVARDHTVGL